MNIYIAYMLSVFRNQEYVYVTTADSESWMISVKSCSMNW